MKKLSKGNINLIIICILYIISVLITLFLPGSGINTSPVLLSRLPMTLHYFVFFILILPIGSLIFSLICMRILLPAFLWIKRKILLRKYKDAYIVIQKKPFSVKKYYKRTILAFLFSVGIYLLLEPLNLIPLEMFLPKEFLEWIIRDGIEITKYNVNVYSGYVMLIAPFTFGISSMMWALEDAALIHYNLPDENSVVRFEIEPVNVRFSSYIDGFTGFSSLYFYIIAIITNTDNFTNVLVMIFMAIIFSGNMFPAYFFYRRFNKDFLKKNLPERRVLTEKEYANN